MKDKDIWYKKLLLYSLLIGLAGGVGALLFTSITGGGSNLLFNNKTTETWSGSLYFIPLTAFGAVLVTYLRKKLSIPNEVPGAVELAKKSWVEPSTALPLILIATLSIIFGASLGPSFGIVVIGGAFASWLVTKIGPNFGREEQKEFARTGMTGSLGSVFSAPIIATILTIELSPGKKSYVGTVLPRLISSSIGYIVYFGATGAVILNAFSLPSYTYQHQDMFVGAVLGIMATLFLLAFILITKFTEKLLGLIKHDYLKAIIGGGCVGFLSYALPLTFGSGNSQLASVTSQYTTFGIGILIAIIIGKTVAIKLSQDSGFIGGNIFPMLFFSGLVGILIHAMFPGIPVALSVVAMMASIPGAALTAPIGLILIAVGGIGQSTSIIPPITITVVVTQVCMYLIKSRQALKNN